MWLKLIITAIGLGVVLYFQFVFDINSYIAQTVNDTELKQSEMAKVDRGSTD